MTLRSLAPALLLAITSCATVPSARETLPKLKTAIETVVTSPAMNLDHSKMAEQVSELKHLQGLTRSDVERELGRGAPCERHPTCKERGFYEDDWYYEVGRAGSTYVRNRPALIVGFNRFGKVERTFVLRVDG